MRKLATIEQIKELKPIEKADRIEVAIVKGWECVVKKGEFKEGDLIVYVEVDSILPEKPEFEFLRDRKFRIRTIKLRGQVSQGLVLPLSVLQGKTNIIPEVGIDVTDLIGIKKYLSPSEQAEFREQERRIREDKNKLRKFMMSYSWFRRIFSKVKQKGFPYWVTKTDEERIQNMPQVLEQFADKIVYITEKIDYQSVTFTGKMIPRFEGGLGKLLPKKYKFVVCSRNLINNNKNSLYWQIAEKYNIEQILKENPSLTIQGEQGSSKIQGNKYNITEPTMWIFNVIDHEKGYYYNYNEILAFCRKHSLIPVPLLNKGIKLSELATTVEEIVKESKGYSVLNKEIPREGIVVRCIERGNKVLSFKVVNPEFLLNYE